MANGLQNQINIVSNVVPEHLVRQAQLRALKLFADTVACTYGPLGGFTAYSMQEAGNKKAVYSNYTKDGFTVLKHIEVDKPIESLLKDEIRDICTQVIKRVGDGTTSAVLLAYHIFEGLVKLQELNTIPKRDIVNAFRRTIERAITDIRKAGRPATLDDIYKIALISLDNNEDIAAIIKDIYEKSGMDVFIDVAISNTTETTYRIYNGMTYDSGYIDPSFINNPANSTCELENPHIYVFESPIDTMDMIDAVKYIIEREIAEPTRLAIKQGREGKEITHKATPTLIISPHISRDANGYIDQLINQFTDVPPSSRAPLCLVTNINNMNQFLMDIKAMTGAKFIKKYINLEQRKKDEKDDLAPTFTNIVSFAGSANKVVVDALSTRIIGPKMMYEEDGETYTEFFNNYIAQLQTTLDKYEETKEELVKIGNLKRRINILKTNMVDLYVGGIGVSDRDALRDSVEDAVLNCRSASKDGIGYGANFEGFRVFNQIDIDNAKRRTEAHEDKDNNLTDKEKYLAIVDYAISRIILSAYAHICAFLYSPTESLDQGFKIIAVALSNKHKPYNMVTEQFDDSVLTSIETEPVMLEAIMKIITLLFKTNQFLVPDPRFNIYTMDENNVIKVDASASNSKPDITSGSDMVQETIDLKMVDPPTDKATPIEETTFSNEEIKEITDDEDDKK